MKEQRMKTLYWALGLGGFALLVGAVSFVVLKNTAFRPQQKNTGASIKAKNSLPSAFSPGLEKLAELYKTKSSLILSSSVHVVFAGSVRAIVFNSITLKSGETEITITDQNTQAPIVYVAADRDGKTPRKLGLADINVGDEVNVAAHLDLVKATWTIEYITKLAP